LIPLNNYFQCVQSKYEDFRQKDIDFYTRYCPEDIPVLEWYNTSIRTGNEFFVSNNLLAFFLMNFFLVTFSCDQDIGMITAPAQVPAADVDNAAAPEIGGKKKRKTRKNKKTNKRKTNKRKTRKNKKTNKRKSSKRN
jgi:hypothetical protein